MRTITLAVVGLLLVGSARAEDVLFEDAFKDGLSPKWQVVGLDKNDYRVKDGGLEMRAQNGAVKKNAAMLKVVLPFKVGDNVTASVKVSLLDEFTADKEFAGMYLLSDGGMEFGAKKERIKNKLVFSPGKYVFKGKKGEEGDVEKYEVNYTDATEEAGPVQIVVRDTIGFFMTGPSTKMEYKTYFHSALQKDVKERGFCLIAAGAPDKTAHWVRFTDFKVVKH